MSNVRYTEFPDILAEKIRLKEPLPNIQEVLDPVEGLRAILSGTAYDKPPYEMTIRNFDPPLGQQTHSKAWYPKIFLNSAGMGGRFEGSGTILCTESGFGNNPKVFKFAICEHDWDTSGAKPMRGWHPQRCKKCGFDASIDSGD